MEKKVAIYIRVSTKDQNYESQLEDLTRYAKKRNWQYKVFRDKESGKSNDRPGYKELLDYAFKQKCDVVLVWRFDRFARSTQELINNSEKFKERGIDFVSYQENIDTTTIEGKFFFTVTSAIAEMESNRMSQRIKRGMEYVEKHGTRSGNPIGRPPLPKDDVRTAIRLIDENMGRDEDERFTVKQILTRSGVSKSSYYRILHVCEELEANKQREKEKSYSEIKNNQNVSDRMFDQILKAYNDYYGVSA